MTTENEARDYHGRWTAGGGGIPGETRNVAFHGTTKAFEKFAPGDKTEFMLDRALGPHFAKDPEIANSFVIERVNGRDVGPKEGGRIIPVVLPSDEHFLQTSQPKFDWAEKNPALKEWEGRPSDQSVIEQMVAKEGFMKDPAILERYLQQARALPADKAAEVARDLVAGKKADIDGGSDMDRFVRNYGGRPYNDADRARIAELAKQSWIDKGYEGIKYTNTSPMENATATNPTSYIVFNPDKSVQPLYGEDHHPDTPKFIGETHKYIGDHIAAPPSAPPAPAPPESFKGTKIVDEAGKPLVLYHGGAAGITAFDPTKVGTIQKSDFGKGIYFTPSKGLADQYKIDAAKETDAVGNKLWTDYEDAARKLGTSPMNAAIDLGLGSEKYNQLKVYEDAWRKQRQQVEKEVEAGTRGQTYAVYLDVKNPLNHVYASGSITDPFLHEQAQAHKNDGIVVRNEDGHIEEVIVFKPEQIHIIDPAAPPFELRRQARREQTPHNAAVAGFATAINEAEKHRQTLKRRFGYTDPQIGTMAMNYNSRKTTR